jgi:integrase
VVKAYLEIDETEKLEDAATCLRDKLLIRILSRSGCRVSEALGLTVEDIDFREGTVRIEVNGLSLVIKKEDYRMEGYCVKCRAKKEIKNAKAITMKNGKPATQGICPTCKTKMFRIGSTK